MTSEAAQVQVHNAGLVLLWPYLPRLFETLHILPRADGSARITEPETAARAVHLLQYLVDGRLDTPDAALTLNKLLSGLPLAVPVAPSITASPDDLAICDSLIEAVIHQWKQLGHISPDGLRETFLQRRGMLAQADESWTLKVERAPFDLLLDTLPWSFSLVRLAWMPDPLHVRWR